MNFIIEFGIKSATSAMIKMIKECSEGEEGAEAIAEIRKQMKTQIDAAKQKTADALEEYKANKAERDAAAFKIVDVSGDGTLQKGEFLEAFTLGSAKNEEVMKALGFEM